MGVKRLNRSALTPSNTQEHDQFPVGVLVIQNEDTP